ncbi:MAG: anion permease [Chloroflexi bacterium]|nr:anion permease [Chloroflexota bacterium]
MATQTVVQALAQADAEEQVALKKQITALAIAFGVLFVLHFAPAWTGMTLVGLKPQGQTVLAVFLWFIICMITDALPKAVVGLVGPALIVILGGFKIPDAFKAFTSDSFFLAIGAFIIAAIMMGTPLGKRIALNITTALKSARVTRILLGLSLSDLAIGGVLPTVSETALFLPIAKGVSGLMRGREHLAESKRINTAILLMITGLVPLFTGPLILTSHFPNLQLVAHFQQTQKLAITWMDWFIYNIPLWGLLPVLFVYVVWFFKLNKLEIPGAEVELPKLRQELGRITRPEIWAIGCILLGLAMWVTEGSLHTITAGIVSLIVVLLLFLPFGKLDFKEINKHIMWDVWVLLGGAISLSGALETSGVGQWLAGFIVNPLKGAVGLNAVVVLAIMVFGFHIARAGIVSAVATGAIFIPLTVGVAQQLGMNLLPFTLITTNCLSYAFFLPISITAFMIAWGASGESGWKVMKFGIPLSIIANIYVIIAQTAWMAMLGFPLTK